MLFLPLLGIFQSRVFSFSTRKGWGGRPNNELNKIVFPDQDFFYEDMDSLTQMLRALATDGNKHRAKVDKRKQRSVFRDILRAVEVGLLML